MLSLIFLGALSFAVSLVLTPLLRDCVTRWGFAVDHPDKRRKIHTAPVPRLGGVTILVSYGFALLAFRLISQKWGASWPQDLRISWLVIAAVAVMFATGLIDDIFGLKPWQKLCGQLAASFIVYSSGVQIHVIQSHQLDSWVSLPVTIAWLIICSN